MKEFRSPRSLLGSPRLSCIERCVLFFALLTLVLIGLEFVPRDAWGANGTVVPRGPLAGMPALTRSGDRRKSCIAPAEEMIDEASLLGLGRPGPIWMQTYWEPCVACLDEERVGLRGEGGKWICNAQKLLSHSSRVGGGACTVLSVGSRNEFEFEREVMERWGCAVDVFDHTSEPPEYVSKGVSEKMEPSQISSASPGELTFHKKMFDLSELLSFQVTSEDDKTRGRGMVDVFKIDCEGCEYEIFNDPRAQRWLRAHVGVLLIEVHWPGGQHETGYEGPETDKKVELISGLRDDFFEAGMITYHKEPNIAYSDGSTVEFAMVNKALIDNWESGGLISGALRGH